MIKKLDVLVLILLPLLAVFVSLALKTNFFVSTILFYGLPAIYLSWRNPHAVKRATIFSIASLPVMFIADYFAVLTKAWYVPSPLLPRILGIVPLDDMFWGFAVIYVVVIFYEHFLDKGRHNVVDKKLKYPTYLFLSILVVVLSLHFFAPNLLRIPYFYLTGMGILGFSPIVIFLSHFPRFIGKYSKVVIYFTFLNLIYELTAMELGWWTFPGKEFIGWVEIGRYRFPFEEFFFYIVLSSVAFLSYFEYFDDNKLKKEAKRYT